MTYKNVKVPEGGAKITMQDGKLQVPDNPILPFIEGDGTGRDIWAASVARVRCGRREGLRRETQNPLDGSVCRREIL